MNVLEELLKNLQLKEAGFKYLTPSLKEKIIVLKHQTMHSLPFWNSISTHSEFTSFRQREEQEFLQKWKDSDDWNSFIDGMLRFSELRLSFAEKFYGSMGGYVFYWRGCFELILDNLEYAQSLDNLTVTMMEKVRAAEQGLRMLKNFFKFVVNISNYFYCMDGCMHLEDVLLKIAWCAPRAENIFWCCVSYKEDSNRINSELEDQLKRIHDAQLQAKQAYLDILQALRLTQADAWHVEFQTICHLVDKLVNVLRAIVDDFLASGDSVEQNTTVDILMELKLIRSILKLLTLEESRVYGICAAISTHIDILAANAIDALSTSYLSETNLTIVSAKEEIRQIRLSIRKDMILGNSPGEAFLNLLELSEGVSVVSIIAAECHIVKLKLLQSSIRDKDKLIGLNPELENMCERIESMFCEAWWDLRSQCFRTLRSKYLPFRSKFLDKIAAMTPIASELLFDLSKSVVHMPKGTDMLLDVVKIFTQKPVGAQLLLDFLSHLVSYLTELLDYGADVVWPVKNDVKILQSEVIILRFIFKDVLWHYCEENDLIDLFEDIKVGAIEATSICVLFLMEINENTYSRMLGIVKFFKGLVRQAYQRYAKLSPSVAQLPKSEFEISDVLVNLTEFEKREADSEAFSVQEIIGLKHHLLFCSSFLQNNAFKHDKREEVKHLQMQTMRVFRKVELVINAFDEVSVAFFKVRLSDVTEEVKLTKEEITKIHGTNKSNTDVRNNQKQKAKYKAAQPFDGVIPNPSNTQGEIISGFKDEEVMLGKKLTTGSRMLEIISIVGMPGLGKTTLAMNVYKVYAKCFHRHAWCYVSQDNNRKELLHNIICQIDGPSKEFDRMKEEDLAQSLYQSLLRKTYLIVLDDIWDIKSWNALKTCFPHGSNGSRILLTSRFKPLGSKISQGSTCVELQLLTKDKSWHLLENKVFGAGTCPWQLRNVGMEIAEKCGGLPLSIVVIAGVLKNVETAQDQWKEVAESLDSRFVVNQEGVSSKLELSYSHLTHHMKQCLLYCGAFVRGKEIPRSKLVRLWAAERFVEEEAAEDYLSGLVDRCLLIVTKKSFTNRIRTCRIHDLLHDFCIKRAEEEKFLTPMERCDNLASFQRRLHYHFTAGNEFLKFKDSFPSTPHTRSLLLGNAYKWESSQQVHNFAKFKLLNLLDLENIETCKAIFKCVAQLKWLRYLAVRGMFERIPSSIGELVNLETLIVRGTRGEVDIPYTIFNLAKLRHLLVNNSANIRGNENCKSLACLQTFSTPALSWRSAQPIIRILPGLRKLICIFLESLDIIGKTNVFPLLDSLSNLESLNVTYHGMVRFPCKFSFPTTLKKLSLSKFCLPWSQIEQISTSLPQLEVLKLLFNAFRGHTWVTSTAFPNLKYLRLEELDIRDWEASDDHFPILNKLVVRRCKRLVSIPFNFGDLEDLECVEVHMCSHSVAKSALEMKRTQKYNGNNHFDVIIYPTELDLVEECV